MKVGIKSVKVPSSGLHRMFSEEKKQYTDSLSQASNSAAPPPGKISFYMALCFLVFCKKGTCPLYRFKEAYTGPRKTRPSLSGHPVEYMHSNTRPKLRTFTCQNFWCLWFLLSTKHFVAGRAAEGPRRRVSVPSIYVSLIKTFTERILAMAVRTSVISFWPVSTCF